jgi:hypothetical protein
LDSLAYFRIYLGYFKMNKKHNLFLDLEGVIIDDWYSGIPLWENLAGIKEWIRRHKPNKVFIFSAAVWNDKDKQKVYAMGTLVNKLEQMCSYYIKADVEVFSWYYADLL